MDKKKTCRLWIKKAFCRLWIKKSLLQVYFDTIAFENKPNHSYAKLLPEAFGAGDKDALMKNMRESEGELSMGNLAVMKLFLRFYSE